MATILFFEFASQILLHSPWRKIKWWEASEELWHFQGFFLKFEKQICNIEIKNFSCRGKSYFGWSASHIMWLPMTNFREGDNLDELISYKWSKIVIWLKNRCVILNTWSKRCSLREVWPHIFKKFCQKAYVCPLALNVLINTSS